MKLFWGILVHVLYVMCMCMMDILYCYFCAVFQSLTLTFRAVEVFIRDKYERKKYYDKEALDAAPVSINHTQQLHFNILRILSCQSMLL